MTTGTAVISEHKIVVVCMIDRLALGSGVSGGTERQVVEMLNRLDRRAFRPIFICSQQRTATPLWDQVRCEKHLTNLFSLFSWKALKTLFWLVRLFRRESVDLVVAYFIDSTLLGIIAARLAGVKCTVSTRRDMGYWHDRKITLLLRIVNLMTTRILANAHEVKKQVAKNEQVDLRKVDVIHNGIDLERFDAIPPVNLAEKFPKIQEGDEIVGLVANFDRSVKRADLFIAAASEVLKRKGSVRFVIVGGGALEDELRDQAKRLEISDNVIFAGPVHDAAAYIKAFDVGVLCSDSEGLSNTIIEYMAASLPCVVTATGGNVELVRDRETGLLVQPGNSVNLAEAISTLLENKEVASRYGASARKMVEAEYDWKRRIGEVEDYYRRLILFPGCLGLSDDRIPAVRSS